MIIEAVYGMKVILIGVTMAMKMNVASMLMMLVLYVVEVIRATEHVEEIQLLAVMDCVVVT